MKSIFLITAFLVTCIHIQAQVNPQTQDPEAGKILEKVSARFSSLPSLQTDFELIINDRKENKKNSSSGNLVMKQNKYKLTSEGNIVYFDGKTMWSYITANNEVTITEPEVNKTDFLSNPSSFFSSYKSEFKYRYVGASTRNGIPCHEIDLFPMNLDQPYSRIKVYINKATDLPEAITSVGKDGVDYTVNLKNTILNKDFPDSTFVFNLAQHKKAEVVDMRGL